MAGALTAYTMPPMIASTMKRKMSIGAAISCGQIANALRPTIKTPSTHNRPPTPCYRCLSLSDRLFLRLSKITLTLVGPPIYRSIRRVSFSLLASRFSLLHLLGASRAGHHAVRCSCSAVQYCDGQCERAALRIRTPRPVR